MTRSQRRLALLVLASPLLISLCGCVILGVILGKAVGDMPIPAQYTLEKRPTLVLAENRESASLSALDGDRLNRLITLELNRHELAPTIDPDALIRLRDSEPGTFHRRSIASIAKALKAEQVLYVQIEAVAVGVSPGSDVLKGVAGGQLKLIDVASGQVLFPPEMNDGLPVGFETPVRRPTDGVNQASVRDEALEGLARRIGQLFRDHQADEEEIGSTLQ